MESVHRSRRRVSSRHFVVDVCSVLEGKRTQRDCAVILRITETAPAKKPAEEGLVGCLVS